MKYNFDRIASCHASNQSCISTQTCQAINFDFFMKRGPGCLAITFAAAAEIIKIAQQICGTELTEGLQKLCLYSSYLFLRRRCAQHLVVNKHCMNDVRMPQDHETCQDASDIGDLIVSPRDLGQSGFESNLGVPRSERVVYWLLMGVKAGVSQTDAWFFNLISISYLISNLCAFHTSVWIFCS